MSRGAGMRTGPAHRPVTMVAAALLALAALAGCAPAPAYPLPAPPLAGEDLQGRPQDLAALHGSVVIVPVWASWCGPCRDEVPLLQEALSRWGGDDLAVLGINMRDRDESARTFLAEHGGDYPSVADRRGTVAVGWGVTTLPVTFLVDRDGQVVARHHGVITPEWLDDVVLREVTGQVFGQITGPVSEPVARQAAGADP